MPFVSSSAGMGRLRTNALETLWSAYLDADEDDRARIAPVAERWDGALSEDVALLAG